MNQKPPDVKIKKKERGGIDFQWLCPQTKGMNQDIATRILKEYRINCATVTFREDVTHDQFIDVCDGKRTYIPGLYVMNKIDQLTIEELDIIDEIPNYVPISSRDEWNIDELMETIWQKCNMLRVYTKPKGQVPDYDEPVVLHADGPTVEQFCNRIHKSIMEQFKYAWVWGSSCRHQPQKVGKDHVLADEDVDPGGVLLLRRFDVNSRARRLVASTASGVPAATRRAPSRGVVAGHRARACAARRPHRHASRRPRSPRLQ